jgi:hypothetical protein
MNRREISISEEAGLWLRFFAACIVFLYPKKKPAGMTDGL